MILTGAVYRIRRSLQYSHSTKWFAVNWWTQVALWHQPCLNKDLTPHESLESPLIELRFDRRELFFVCSQTVHFCKLLSFLATVPLLQEVDHWYVVGLEAVWRDETMTLESRELSCRWGTRIFATSIFNLVIKVSYIHKHFRLDAKQDWIVHNLTRSQEVCVFSNGRVHIFDILPRHIDFLNIVLVHHKVLIF